MEAVGFKYISFGRHYKSKWGKIWGLFKFDFKMLLTALKFNPDVFLSHGSFYSAHIAFLIRKPHISMEDSGNMEQIRLYLPFSKAVLTPNELREKLGEKQIRYHAYHELAYLNPKYFKPDSGILEALGVKENEKFVLLRLVSWNATHDVGQGGFTIKQKEELVNYLSSKMRLFISAEGEVLDAFKKYIIKIKPDQMHHVLAFADLVVSEGATMASEAGVLGTPAVYVNSLARCYNEDQEKYGTVFNFRNGVGILEKVKEIIKSDIKKEMRNKSIFRDKIDVTAFLVWFVSEWSESFKIMKENPDYQYNFK